MELLHGLHHFNGDTDHLLRLRASQDPLLQVSRLSQNHLSTCSDIHVALCRIIVVHCNVAVCIFMTIYLLDPVVSLRLKYLYIAARVPREVELACELHSVQQEALHCGIEYLARLENVRGGIEVVSVKVFALRRGVSNKIAPRWVPLAHGHHCSLVN